MKAYFLPLGEGADRALPSLLTALSCGAARQAETVTVLRTVPAAPDALAGRLMADLEVCRRLFSGEDAFAFFRTAFRSDFWVPELPGRDSLAAGEESRLLLQALRGDGIPFSFRTDREAVEWSASALLDALPADPGELLSGGDTSLRPHK